MEMLAITTNDIFAEAGSTLTGFMDLTTDFFTNLWNIPMGKIVITIGLVSASIKLGKTIFYLRYYFSLPKCTVYIDDDE